MIRTLLVLEDSNIQFDAPIETIGLEQEKLFWVDFSEPTEKEVRYLSEGF
ncbi:hypothetical protein P378_18980 [Desulforamulus profundi]|uniref:Magnesium and cobalt transport protein CorA n=1 Tax=Desulforamulus profundi TaxID=1383067 RepID=A0A2C6MBQ8_9FIRM|nr:hypothetical protein [Desulforamulus profundi]PHJ36992.1 hypothetical protein P378_18980 [Desulforamulus profundi]